MNPINAPPTEQEKKHAKYLALGITISFIAIFGWILISEGTVIGKPDIRIGEKQGTNWFGQVKVSFQIYNTGSAPAKNVYADIQILDSDQRTILKTKSVFIGTLDPGESQTISTTIEGTIPEKSGYRIIPRY